MTTETDCRDVDELLQQKMLSKPTSQGRKCLNNLSVCLWCLFIFCWFISPPACLCLFFFCLNASQNICTFHFLCHSGYSSVLLQGHLRSPELCILVISGCHHKRLRATLTSCITTKKKPLLCNALMLPLLMLLLTMSELRAGERQRRRREMWEGKDESQTGTCSLLNEQRKTEERSSVYLLWHCMSCVSYSAHELRPTISVLDVLAAWFSFSVTPRPRAYSRMTSLTIGGKTPLCLLPCIKSHDEMMLMHPRCVCMSGDCCFVLWLKKG